MTDDARHRDLRVVALCGGVGGARLLDGLAQVLPAAHLTAIVNTGDDFEHWGLTIAPDLDTVMYTLAGIAHEARGWGLAYETLEGLEMVQRYGGDSWFQLGDRDLATHLMRTHWLREGATLSEVTARLCDALDVGPRVLPMADAPRRTVIVTGDGPLPFQRWLVEERGEPEVREVRFEGADAPAPDVIGAIDAADLVVISSSNPYVSIDPILTLRGVRDAVSARPVVGVSPIVGGRAVKGPLARMIPALEGSEPSAGAVARHYGGLLDGWVVEVGDEDGVDVPHVLATGTVMGNRHDRERLATEVLDFAVSWIPSS